MIPKILKNMKKRKLGFGRGNGLLYRIRGTPISPSLCAPQAPQQLFLLARRRQPPSYHAVHNSVTIYMPQGSWRV
jgi:hypothetical protein